VICCCAAAGSVATKNKKSKAFVYFIFADGKKPPILVKNYELPLLFSVKYIFKNH
jgi:hypothetical protein